MVDIIQDFLGVKELAPLCVEPYTLLLWYMEKEKEITTEIERKDLRYTTRRSLAHCLGKAAEKEFVKTGNLFKVLLDYAYENILLDLLENDEDELLDRAIGTDQFILNTVSELIIKNDIFSQLWRIDKLPSYSIYNQQRVKVSPEMASILIKKFPKDRDLIMILAFTGDIELVKKHERTLPYSPSFNYIDMIRIIPYKDLDSWFEIIDDRISEFKGDTYPKNRLLTEVLGNPDPRVIKYVYSCFPNNRVPDSLGGSSNTHITLSPEIAEYLIDNKQIDTGKIIVFKSRPSVSLLEKMYRLGYKASTRKFITRQIGEDFTSLLKEYEIYVEI